MSISHANKAAKAAIDKVGLLDAINMPSYELSGGMKRKMFVAMALASDADVGSSCVESILRRVVFPAPFLPIIEVIFLSRVKLTPLSACFPLYCFDSPLTSIMLPLPRHVISNINRVRFI